MTPAHLQKLKIKAHSYRFESSQSRIKRLKKLQSWIKNNEPLIEEALFKDFEKPAFETQLSEITVVLHEIKFAIDHVAKWMKDKSVSTPLFLLGHRSRIRFENKGVALIIAPWNYPFQLTLEPLIGALAAGNTAVLKPSELTPHTSNLIKQLCDDCFSDDEVLVALGDKDVTSTLLNLPFDHVFFTGSTAVGKIIATKCAASLIPYTLELGGKSPTIIDETADLEEAAAKIHWSKFLNRGQTCIAPDYILIHNNVYEKFLLEFKKISDSIPVAQEQSHIINRHHSERLSKLSHGQFSPDKISTALYPCEVAPALMNEEIFGPLAPVIRYTNMQDLTSVITQHPNPLALYIFSKNIDFCDQLIRQFPSGGVGINATNVHITNSYLPFGGIGSSGSGRYHGYFSFLEFSHQRAIMSHDFLKSMIRFVFPPYTMQKKRIVGFLKKLTT